MLVKLAAIFFSMILVNNYVLVKFYGICPFLGVSKKLDSSLGMSGAVIFVMLVATAVTFPLQIFLLDAYNLGYLQTIIFILVIAYVIGIIRFIFIFIIGIFIIKTVIFVLFGIVVHRRKPPFKNIFQIFFDFPKKQFR